MLRLHQFDRVDRVRLRRGVVCLGLLVATGIASTPEAADAPAPSAAITFTPDTQRVLINRNVGEERWAITRNATDGTLTGNVYHEDGRVPQFVWCVPTSAIEDRDPARARYIYDCYGTMPCDETRCPDWAFISEVTLNGRFFLPPGSGSPKPAPSPTPRPVTSPTATTAATQTPGRTATPGPPSATTTPAATVTAARTATPAPVPTATPLPTVTRGPLVVTPDKATMSVSTSFLFVVTGGDPPYSVFASNGGQVAPAVVDRAGLPFTFTAAEIAGTTTIIVVDRSQALKTVTVTVK